VASRGGGAGADVLPHAPAGLCPTTASGRPRRAARERGGKDAPWDCTVKAAHGSMTADKSAANTAHCRSILPPSFFPVLPCATTLSNAESRVQSLIPDST